MANWRADQSDFVLECIELTESEIKSITLIILMKWRLIKACLVKME